jgi:hypothetical protein
VLRKKQMMPLLALAMGACAAPSTPLPATTDLLKDLPRVDNSAKSPCWQQQQIARQNSWMAAATGTDREAAYKAPCEVASNHPDVVRKQN